MVKKDNYLNFSQDFIKFAGKLAQSWTEEKHSGELNVEEKEKKADCLAEAVAGLIYWEIIQSLSNKDIEELNRKAQSRITFQESADWLEEKINFEEVLVKVKKRFYERA